MRRPLFVGPRRPLFKGDVLDSVNEKEGKMHGMTILFIPQGSVRVSAVPVRLSTADTQPTHLSL